MNEFLKMDIFFFIATFAVLIFSVLASLLVYYLVQIARNIRDITEVIQKETHETVKDFRELRKDLRAGVQTAKEYTSVFKGANILRGITNIVHTFIDNAKPEQKRQTTRKRKVKKESTD